jgi:hypothetical protein
LAGAEVACCHILRQQLAVRVGALLQLRKNTGLRFGGLMLPQFFFT